MRASNHQNQTESTTTMSNHQISNIHTLSVPSANSVCPPTTQDLMLYVVQVRKMVRRAVAVLESQYDNARKYRRRACILRGHAGVFDGARIAALDAAAAEVTALCKPLRESLHNCGKLLTNAAPMIDAGTTLAQRCEILNVNTADRGDLTDADGLIKIIYLHGLEDSAANRKAEDKNGPMFQASQQVFMDFLMNHKEGRKLGDCLFQPGGMFADVPMFKQAADGTMKRQPPRLHVVPDARSELASGGVL